MWLPARVNVAKSYFFTQTCVEIEKAEKKTPQNMLSGEVSEFILVCFIAFAVPGFFEGIMSWEGYLVHRALLICAKRMHERTSVKFYRSFALSIEATLVLNGMAVSCFIIRNTFTKIFEFFSHTV